MPKLDSYESSAGVRFNAPVKVSPELSGTKEQQEAIQAIKNAEAALTKVRDFREGNEAHNFVSNRLNEIKYLADQDINFDSSIYDTEIDKAINEGSKTISSQLAKEAFIANAQKKGDAMKWDIKNLFRDREIDAAKSSIAYSKKFALDNIGAMDQAGTLATLAGFRKTLEDAVANGIIYKEAADLDFEDFKTKAANAQAYYQVMKNPGEAIAELELGEEGLFADLPSEQRQKYIGQAQAKIRSMASQEKAIEGERQRNMVVRYIESIANGEIDLENDPDLIRNMYGQNFALAEAMEKSAMLGRRSLVMSDKANQAFADAAVNIFKAGNEKQITDFLTGALGNSDKISRDRLGALVYAAKKRADELRRGEKQGFWSGLFDWWKNVTPLGQVNHMVRSIERIKAEEAGEERAEVIVKEEIDKAKKLDRKEVLTENDLAIDEEIPTFATVEEGNAANLPVGTRVIINGQTYEMK